MAYSNFAVWILLAAFLPPLFFLVYVRNLERVRREPWGAIFTAFFFGAIVSVLVALLLEVVLHFQVREYDILRGQFSIPEVVFLVVVIAPLVEEFAKGLGVRTARRYIVEEEDGIIYGAAAGFGFAATENLLYEVSALVTEGETAYIATAIVRTFTGSFLHATASGIVGYGIGKMYRQRSTLFEVVPYFAVAVLLHAAFNLVAVLQFPAAVGLAIVFAFIAMRYTVHKIRRLDAAPAPYAWGRGRT